MSTFVLYGLTAAGLTAIALYSLIFQPHLVRKLIALNVMGASVFLLLTAVAHRNETEAADPVPHAMVLTGIVVAVSATAFALALARRIHSDTLRTDLPDNDRE